ncbi:MULTISPECIES: fimbria/pilus outer membrane usher protein [Burkholderia]|uniref:Fimbrial biogenesis outer membrane usher protein n=2 Tax=Burkholderia anthina TaxID=179879 RepID=A0ABS2B7Z1_9BURK|nr:MULTISPECIES: fimbria/pilus outer membrane usher protein [Burkholderia]MBM2769079.1 fimbrial biogenesis outer membrane usher protein [Burkholderia anthina]
MRLLLSMALLTGSGITPLTATADGDKAVFNNEFLHLGGGPQQVDLSVFAFGNRVLPGRYQATIAVNGERFEKEDIDMVASSEDVDATPCLTRAQLARWNINTAAFESISKAAEDACIDIAEAIPQASAQFNVATQTLEISVPQAAMLRRARGTVPVDQLDNGTTALMFNYQLNGNHDHLNQQSSLYANISAGFNVGPWRFRNLSTFNRDHHGSRFESRTAYAERALLGLHSRLTIGDTYTTGIGVDSFGLRGVQLQTDETMRPDSMRGYAPSVRGIARTSAEVTIRQNGYVINKVYVPPGPFVIDDLYATPGAGDLEITIIEADGATTRYTQPYAALPTLVRDGLVNYSVAVGRYRDSSLSNGPYVGQGMVAYGLTSDVTLYGSAILSGIYGAVAAGTGLNLKNFGALAIDITRTHVYSPNAPRVSGSALRLTYAKSLPGYGTHFRMVSTRYMTEGYRSFAQAAHENSRGWKYQGNLRTELSASIAQQFGAYGSLYATATRQAYRDSRGTDTLLQVSYATSIRKATTSINYNEISNGQSPRKERQVLLNVSMPLGQSATSAAYQLRGDGNGNMNHQASLFGSLLAGKNLSYTAQLAKSTRGPHNAYGSLYYQGSKGNIGVSHNEGSNSRQSQISVGGGMIVDRQGPLFSQPLGETVGIIEVPEAAGVMVDGYPGVTTDSNGRAVVPSLVPYRRNRISVDATQTAKDNVDLVESAVSVAPTRGAVTYSVLRADVGMRMFARLRSPDGEDVPFGAMVQDQDGQEKGAVGPMGRVFLSGMKDGPVEYSATWGNSAEKRCSFTVEPALLQKDNEEQMMDVVCNNREPQ